MAFTPGKEPRRFTFFFEASVADPAFVLAACELLGDHKYSFFPKWRGRIVARLIRLLLPVNKRGPVLESPK